jgi:hypothetical protein
VIIKKRRDRPPADEDYDLGPYQPEGDINKIDIF